MNKTIMDSLSVDGAWSPTKKHCEYRMVYTANSMQLYSSHVYEDGTNNVAEFLGLVHALSFCKKNNISLPIYTDSLTAMSWVRKKMCNTKLKATNKNEELFNLLDRAEQWLKDNTYINEVLKWHTKQWGEIKADYGRK